MVLYCKRAWRLDSCSPTCEECASWNAALFLWRMGLLFWGAQRTLKDNQHVSGQLSASCSLLSPKKDFSHQEKKKKKMSLIFSWQCSGGDTLTGDQLAQGLRERWRQPHELRGLRRRHTHWTLDTWEHTGKASPCLPRFHHNINLIIILGKHYPSIFHEGID